MSAIDALRATLAAVRPDDACVCDDLAMLHAVVAEHDRTRAAMLDDRARRQAAQRDAAALRKALADMHRDLGAAAESWRKSYDDDVWGERPDAGRITARVEGLNDARERIAAAIARTAKPVRGEP